MRNLSKTATRRALKSLILFNRTRSGSELINGQLAVLVLLFGSMTMQSALADTSIFPSATAGLKLTDAERLSLLQLQERLASVVTTDQVAQAIDTVEAMTDTQREAVLTALSQSGNDVSDWIEWLEARVQEAQTDWIEQGASGITAFAEDVDVQAIESEFAGNEAAEAVSKGVANVTAESGAASASVAGGAVAGETLGLAPAIAPALSPVVGAAVAVGAVTVAANEVGGDTQAQAAMPEAPPSPAPLAPVSVRLTESELARLIAAGKADEAVRFDGQSFAADAVVTVTVEGSTLSDSGLTLVNLSLLGVDNIDVVSDAHVELGFADLVRRIGLEQASTRTGDGFEPARIKKVADASATLGIERNAEVDELVALLDDGASALDYLAEQGVNRVALSQGGRLQLSEAQLDQFKTHGVGIAEGLVDADGFAPTTAVLSVEGSTLSDTGLTVADLVSLGIDEVLADASSDRIEVELGLSRVIAELLGQTSADLDPQVEPLLSDDLNRAIFDALPTFTESARVTLGLDLPEFANLFRTLGSDAQTADGLLKRLEDSHIDHLALSRNQSGAGGDQLQITQQLADRIGTANIGFADQFHQTEGQAEAVYTHLVLKTPVLGNGPLSGEAALTRLGVDEVRITDLGTDGVLGGFTDLDTAVNRVSTLVASGPGAKTVDRPDLIGTSVTASVQVAVDPQLLQDVRSFLSDLQGADALSVSGVVLAAGATILDVAHDLKTLTDLGIDQLVIGGIDVLDSLNLDDFDLDSLSKL